MRFCFCLLVLLSFNINALELTFGVYAADKPTLVVNQFRPILDVLEVSLSRKLNQDTRIKLSVASNYEKGIKELVDGKVDFYRLGPASYIESKRRNSGIKILAIESFRGEKHFNGIICIPASSNLNSLAELKNKRFAFGNEHSTIGRYLSQLYLIQHGVNSSNLASYHYLGRHDKVGSAVAMGLYDAGALKESSYNELLKSGHKLKPLVTFKVVTKPWVARSGLEIKLQNALQEALLEFDDIKTLAGLEKTGFLIGDDSDYEPIRLAMEKNTLFGGR